MFPERFGNYVEPFVGSGAVFFALLPESAVLADTNRELIETYEAIVSEPGKVIAALKIHSRKHDSEYYYKVRESKPYSAHGKAARMIYLNRTCFNGLYRVNSRGKFNVPRGTRNSVIFEEDNFHGIASILERVQFKCEDFEETLEHCIKGDLAFVDPPYTVKHNTNAFIKYNERMFSWDDQIRLAGCLTRLAQRGVQVVMTNADHCAIRELYPRKIWKLRSLSRTSLLASDSDRRGGTTELLVTSRGD